MKINRRQDTVLKGKTEGKKEREQSFRVSIPHTMHADTGTQRRKEKIPHNAAIVSAILFQWTLWQNLMAFLYMGFSCQDDLEKIEGTDPFRNGMIVISGNETEIHDFEFGPIEHPIEPLDEDHPVTCPMLNSSVMNNGSMQDERFSNNMKKISEQQIWKEQRVTAPATEAPTLRTLRKRHHTQTSVEGHTCSPFLRTPPRDLTIFNMLQHFDKV
ncbi:hypothetical protein ACET3Z_029978 [Daucus carota]